MPKNTKESIINFLYKKLINYSSINYSNENDFKLGDNLINDLGLDTIDICELIISIENTYNIHIDDIDIDRFNTIEDIVDFLIVITNP